MNRLELTLEEGFSGDAVDIEVDGKNVYSKDSVTTRNQIGLADIVRLEVEPDARELRVTVRSRSASFSMPLELPDRAYIGVSLTAEGEISHRTSREPFRFA